MALTTLADVKAYLGIPVDFTDDDVRLEMWRESSEQSIINFCETDFQPHVTVGEWHDGGRSDVLVPKNYPIISVQAVKLSVDGNGSGGWELAADEYYFDHSAITLRINKTPKGRMNILIDYTYGYSSVPADVKLCVYQAVKAERQRYEADSENVSSISKGDESTSYGGAWDKKSGLPSQIISKLQAYRIYEVPNISTAQRNW